MKLEFDVGVRSNYWNVNIWARKTGWQYESYPYREYLTEEQYVRLLQWCHKTFHTSKDRYRIRRMSYADFWFKHKKDLDWFILCWSGVDSDLI